MEGFRDFPAGPVVKTLHFQPRGTGWVPGQLAMQCGQEKKSCGEGLRETGRKEYLETACWETVLHGTLTFLPIVQAKELTPLTHTPPDNLFKDVCKRTTLEE